MILVIFFRNLQLFEAFNFWRFFKTHTLTHTGKGAESTGQGQTGIFLSGPVFLPHLLADDPHRWRPRRLASSGLWRGYRCSRGKISDDLRQEALYLAGSYRDKTLMDNDYAADGYARDMELEIFTLKGM